MAYQTDEQHGDPEHFEDLELNAAHPTDSGCGRPSTRTLLLGALGVGAVVGVALYVSGGSGTATHAIQTNAQTAPALQQDAHPKGDKPNSEAPAAGTSGYDWSKWVAGGANGAQGGAGAYDWSKWTGGANGAQAKPEKGDKKHPAHDAPAVGAEGGYDWSKWAGGGANGAQSGAGAYDWSKWTGGANGAPASAVQQEAHPPKDDKAAPAGEGNDWRGGNSGGFDWGKYAGGAQNGDKTAGGAMNGGYDYSKWAGGAKDAQGGAGAYDWSKWTGGANGAQPGAGAYDWSKWAGGANGQQGGFPGQNPGDWSKWGAPADSAQGKPEEGGKPTEGHKKHPAPEVPAAGAQGGYDWSKWTGGQGGGGYDWSKWAGGAYRAQPGR